MAPRAPGGVAGSIPVLIGFCLCAVQASPHRTQQDGRWSDYLEDMIRNGEKELQTVQLKVSECIRDMRLRAAIAVGNSSPEMHRRMVGLELQIRRSADVIRRQLTVLIVFLANWFRAILPSGFRRHANTSAWQFVTLMMVLGMSCSLLLLRRRRTTSTNSSLTNGAITSTALPKDDAASSDPGLLKKHSEFKSYTITVGGRSTTYPSIRTFYSPHPQAAKLPTSPTPIPLLVFVHGLGGSVAQFAPLLTSLVNAAPCLAIDLPGCGLSSFEPKSWDAYKLETLAELLGQAIEQHRDKALGQEVVLIGHSLGCSLSLLLASSNSSIFAAKMLAKHILGMAAICPRAEPPKEKEVSLFTRLLAIPGPVFDLWRGWDRRGGTESASVARFVGADAETDTKRLQVRFNEQSKTAVWRRMAGGALPDYRKHPIGGIPGKETWQGLSVPLMLIAGEADKVTPATEIEKIAGFLGKTSKKEASEQSHTSESLIDAAAPVDICTAVNAADGSAHTQEGDVSRENSGSTLVGSMAEMNKERKTVGPTKHSAPLKTTILPSPAAHALLYAPPSVRIIAGLLQQFLASHVDPRLSLGWQLQYLSTEGKWDVKNLAKWQKVVSVSDPIPGPAPPEDHSKDFRNPWMKGSNVARNLSTAQAGELRRTPVFRAMKTLREVDDVHSPSVFARRWRGKIKAVVDISHESPVYSPENLEKGGIQYFKFPTVSKLPPAADEVRNFIALIDRLCAELGVGGGETDAADANGAPVIGVHCHYGYNRTGFFVVSYLVERCGFRLQDAIDEFERQRPPGIRHGHFIDALFVRYCVGLKRAPTL